MIKEQIQQYIDENKHKQLYLIAWYKLNHYYLTMLTTNDVYFINHKLRYGDYQYSNDNFKFSLHSLGKNKYIRIKEQNDNDIYYLTNKG